MLIIIMKKKKKEIYLFIRDFLSIQLTDVYFLSPLFQLLNKCAFFFSLIISLNFPFKKKLFPYAK